jgi:hypothetical protein
MGPFDGRSADLIYQCDGLWGSGATADLQCRAKAA